MSDKKVLRAACCRCGWSHTFESMTSNKCPGCGEELMVSVKDPFVICTHCKTAVAESFLTQAVRACPKCGNKL